MSLHRHFFSKSLVVVLAHSILLVAGNQSVRPFSSCEGRTQTVNCEEGELINIVANSVKYGLLSENYCATPPIQDMNYQECLADQVKSQQIITDLCHKKQSCNIPANDSLFELGPCTDQDTTASRLMFRHSCIKVELWTTATPVTQEAVDVETRTATLPTSPTQPTLATVPEPCRHDDTKTQDCYIWLCASGVWERKTINKEDRDCCSLWEGCNSFQNSDPEELRSEAIPTTSAVPAITNASSQVDDTVDVETTTTLNMPEKTTTVMPETTSLMSTILLSSSSKNPLNLVTVIGQVNTTAQKIPRCEAENTTQRFNLTWPETKASTTMTKDCPGDERMPKAAVFRRCGIDGEWLAVDSRRCPSPRVLNIINQGVDEEDLETFSADLVEVVSGGGLVSGDIGAVTRVLYQIADNLQLKGSEERPPQDVINITQNVFEAGDSLLSTSTNPSWEDDEEDNDKASRAMEVVSALESVAQKAAFTVTSDTTVKTKSIEMSVKVVQLQDIAENLTISVRTQDGSIEFPSTNLVADSPGSVYGKLVTVFYDQNTEIWNTDTGTTSNGSCNPCVNTPVFSASVLDYRSNKARRNLTTPFTYTLNHLQHGSKDDQHLCVFWNENVEPSRWSGDGCRRVGGDDQHTKCECDHMTNFAVLLDVTGANEKITAEHDMALRIITYAGCITSIICLLLAWMTFQFLKNLSSDRNTIHKHLVFSLMLAESLFLVAISPQVVKIKVLCSVIAGTLHFLFLSVFAWTCLEGVQLYIMLIEVFEAERSRTMYYYLVGYGIPGIVVGVSAAVDYTGYGTETVCWLKTSTGFIWSFVGPVAAVMLVNIVMLGVAIYMMYNHAKMVANMKHKETTRLENIRAWIKGAIVLVILLGITWVFGFFFVHDEGLVMAYLFTILNSFQGLFIFLFHCVGNEKVQKEYKKVVRRTQWLPDCLRVGYGEHKGLTTLQSHSSGSNGYISRYFSKRRKSSDLISGSLRGSSKKPINGLNSTHSTHSNNISFDDNSASKEPLTSPKKLSPSPSNNNSVSDDAQHPLTGTHSVDLSLHDLNQSLC